MERRAGACDFRSMEIELLSRGHARMYMLVSKFSEVSGWNYVHCMNPSQSHHCDGCTATHTHALSFMATSLCVQFPALHHCMYICTRWKLQPAIRLIIEVCTLLILSCFLSTISPCWLWYTTNTGASMHPHFVYWARPSSLLVPRAYKTRMWVYMYCTLHVYSMTAKIHKTGWQNNYAKFRIRTLRGLSNYHTRSNNIRLCKHVHEARTHGR